MLSPAGGLGEAEHVPAVAQADGDGAGGGGAGGEGAGGGAGSQRFPRLLRLQADLRHRDHCRLDLHRYNLKVGLRGRPPLTEGESEGILEQLEGDEEEEISGSEEEEEEAEEEGVCVMAWEARVVLKTADGRLVAVHRCLLAAGRDLPGREELRAAVLGLPGRTTWAVIMLGGGHFAGAVFRAGDLWVHNTFHIYTVRAKQGGSQGSCSTSRTSRGSGPSRWPPVTSSKAPPPPT